MRPVLLIICALSLVIFTAGCARAPGGIAPSNIPLAPGGYTPIGRVSASDCKINLFGLIPVSGGNRVTGAIDSALRRESRADALVGISIDHVFKYFILWSSNCTEVHATAVTVP